MNFKNFQTLFKTSSFYKTVYFLFFFLLIFISGVTYRHTVDLNQSSQLILHTQQVRFELEHIISYIKDAETGQRGYIITHDSIFLDPYLTAREKINRSWNLTKDLTKDNPLQQNNLDTLAQLINLRFTLLAKSLAAISPTGFNETFLRDNMIKGNRAMDSTRKEVDMMIQIENSLFKNREKTYANQNSFSSPLTLLFFLFCLILMVLTFLKITRDLNTLNKTNSELLISNELFKHAEKIGGFSTWQWDLQTDKRIFSDNHYVLLGFESKNVESALEKIIELVHPDDLDLVRTRSQDKEIRHDTRNIIYRTFRKNDGALRYFKSTSTIITDAAGKKFRIGVNYDITEQTLTSLALEQKNLELKQNYEDILISNELFKHAEKIGGFSTWQVELETNKIIYSDNQYLLLGYDLHSFEPVVEKTTELIHLEDLPLVADTFNAESNKEEVRFTQYRINRKNDGELRYFKSASKIFTNSDGKKFIIGINYDITEQILINIALEQKNLVLKQNYEALLLDTELYQHAENIGGFSTWKLDLETTKLNYSDNHFRLFGYEQHEFEPTLERTTELIHPDDLPVVSRRFDEERNQDGSRITLYRIIRKNDGAVRYFKAASKIFANSEGKKHRIGVNYDITDQTLINRALEEKNLELIQKNKLLDSFNHSASHDLQEPLRKIQMFISRIPGKDRQAISETGNTYLIKIQEAATRMRALIDNLLLFSSADKAEKIFKRSDLNFLIRRAKEECTHHIEEKKAIIELADFPTLNVIPLQIEQLFINLISNALKFSKPDTPSVIKITCELIQAKDYPNLKTIDYTKYYKISVSDNGLGFEQEYAETIFNIFQRLNPTSGLKGTGIGLSICKKIVENHNGFITAQGIPDVGAIFNIFLPI